MGLNTHKTRVVADRRIDGIGIGNKFNETYIDGSHALVIEEDGVPKAVLGFEYDETGVSVVQMQWIDRSHRPSGRWEVALLDIAEDYARHHGQKQVSVRPSQEIGWVQAGKMSPELAHTRYDVTPARSGYKMVNGRRIKIIE